MVCVGEGDITIQEIIQNLPDKMERVAGIFYKKRAGLNQKTGPIISLTDWAKNFTSIQTYWWTDPQILDTYLVS